MELSDEQLREAQLIMLGILKDVHAFCVKNDIHYFLSDGTLIGAIRHNGFIPWDDDIDIGMLRNEYEKFKALVISDTDFNKKYFFQTDETDLGYPSQFGKIRLKGTKWIEKISSESKSPNAGLYIDIFPYDVVPKNRRIRNIKIFKIRFLTILLYLKCKYKITSNSFLKRLLFKFFSLITILMNKKRLCKKRRTLCLKDNAKSGKEYGLTRYSNKNYRVIDELDDYDRLILHTFEDGQFYIPEKYDKVLRNYFGDYMTPPPLNNIHHHFIVDYDFGEFKQQRKNNDK